MDRDKLSYLYVGLAVLLWSTSAAVSKLVLRNLDNFQVPMFTLLFAAITLFLIASFQGKLKLIKTFSLKDYPVMACMGFLIFIYHLFYFGGLKYATAQEGVIINYLWPILTVIFVSILLKEKLTSRGFGGILLGFIGAFIVVTQGNVLGFKFIYIHGDILALLGAVSYALFSVLGKKYQYEKISSLFLYFVFGFLFTFLTVLIFFGIPQISFYEFLGLLWVGIMTQGLAFVFWFKSLEFASNTAKVANILYLSPFLSMVPIYFLVGEAISLSSIIGLMVIFSGILIQNIKA